MLLLPLAALVQLLLLLLLLLQGALTVHEVLFVVGTRGGVQALHDHLLASLL
jgi:hypothetical protein